LPLEEEKGSMPSPIDHHFDIDIDNIRLQTLSSKPYEAVMGDIEKQPLKIDKLSKEKFLSRAAEKRR
jgi:hypothetical protein